MEQNQSNWRSSTGRPPLLVLWTGPAGKNRTITEPPSPAPVSRALAWFASTLLAQTGFRQRPLLQEDASGVAWFRPGRPFRLGTRPELKG